MSDPEKARVTYTLTAYEMKRAAHDFVEARRAAMGEKTNPIGFVNLEVSFDKETDRVLGARLYYTREPNERDDPEQAVRVSGRGRRK